MASGYFKKTWKNKNKNKVTVSLSAAAEISDEKQLEIFFSLNMSLPNDYPSAESVLWR